MPWNLQRSNLQKFLQAKLGLLVSLTTSKFWAAMKDILNGHITYFFDSQDSAKVSIFGIANYYKKYKENSLDLLEEKNNGIIEQTSLLHPKDDFRCPTCNLKVHPRYLCFIHHPSTTTTSPCFQCTGCYATNFYSRNHFVPNVPPDAPDSPVILFSETHTTTNCRVCSTPYALQEEESFQEHEHPVWNVHIYQDPSIPSITFSIPYAWIHSVPTFFPSITAYISSLSETETVTALDYHQQSFNY
jgi:hypothetical protein